MKEPVYGLTQKGMRIVYLMKLHPGLSIAHGEQMLDAIEEADKEYVEYEKRWKSC